MLLTWSDDNRETFKKSLSYTQPFANKILNRGLRDNIMSVQREMSLEWNIKKKQGGKQKINLLLARHANLIWYKHKNTKLYDNVDCYSPDLMIIGKTFKKELLYTQPCANGILNRGSRDHMMSVQTHVDIHIPHTIGDIFHQMVCL